MKYKKQHKESKHERLKRLELSGAVQTRIVPDSKKYTRKNKHKKREI